VIACIIAVGFGGVVAFFITRTNVPFKRFISVLFIFPYIMPSWSMAMFWENFFKNTGVTAAYNQMGFLQAVTGIAVPEWMVYGILPISIVLGVHYAPFAYILIGGILRNMDANLEEAATILKTPRSKVIRRITLPIVMPGIISTVLLVFASSVSSYTVPIFLNKNGKTPTVSTTMQSLVNGNSTKGMGYVVAIILILMSVIILGINTYITSSRKSFTTVTGKSGQISEIKLKKFRYPIGTFLAVMVAFFAIVPLISFGIESFLRIPGDFSSFTTYYWTTNDQIESRIPGDSNGILRNPTIWRAMGSSLLLAFIVAILVGTFGILIGYATARKKGTRIANYVSNLAFFPYLIPALSFGAVYFSLSYMNGFTWLNGSFMLLIIVGTVKFLPFAARSGQNSMLQLSGEIEEAAIVLGIPWYKRMTKVLFPIQKSSFISGYLLPFISSMRELSLYVLIAGSSTVITIVLQNFEISGVTQITNGINLLIITIILIINFVINKVTGASIDKGIGG
jgi:iron(III) transport system permease protein